MRADFATIGSGLTYEIRNIVEIANFMKSKGMEISWENIGDPVMKGEQVPEWIKDVLKEVIDDNMSFAYSPTKGVDSTREYLAAKRNALGGAKITKDDIIFFKFNNSNYWHICSIFYIKNNLVRFFHIIFIYFFYFTTEYIKNRFKN